MLAAALFEMFRQEHVIMPSLDVIDRICGEALTRGTRHVYIALTSGLEARHLLALVIFPLHNRPPVSAYFASFS